jgi:hypothetical protein
MHDHQYLYFSQLDGAANRKTEIWGVFAKQSGLLLGRISWFGRWRQYAFFPERGTVFNPDCLVAITDLALDRTKAHRESLKRKKV